MAAAVNGGMNTEATAWLVVSFAGIACGVIAGVQHHVTLGSVGAIGAIALVATGFVSWILPRSADHAH